MEPKEKLQKARRLFAVQAARERLAEWSLMDIESRLARLHESRASLVRFLDGETPLGGAFAGAMLRRLQGLAESEAALAAEKEARAGRRREERLRLRCAELVVDEHAREARRIDDLRALERVIEAALQRPRVRSEQG